MRSLGHIHIPFQKLPVILLSCGKHLGPGLLRVAIQSCHSGTHSLKGTIRSSIYQVSPPHTHTRGRGRTKLCNLVCPNCKKKSQIAVRFCFFSLYSGQIQAAQIQGDPNTSECRMHSGLPWTPFKQSFPSIYFKLENPPNIYLTLLSVLRAL
uniref:Uncharacterized protein n=1 Tax=Sphaerodactylus townsendi TaxID=933632 RepID=A0ACB8FI10_9SAUR